MNKDEAILIAKEIGAWVHTHTNDSKVNNDRRTIMSVSVFQHVLDIADGIVKLFDTDLPGVAFILARPMHEGYTQAVWLLNHANDEQLSNCEKGIFPKLQTLVKEIGDTPESGGKFIKKNTELNISDFHNLTHGGIEHIARRTSGGNIEPNYEDDEIINLLKLRNQLYLLTAFFLLSLMNKEDEIQKLVEMKKVWHNAL